VQKVVKSEIRLSLSVASREKDARSYGPIWLA